MKFCIVFETYKLFPCLLLLLIVFSGVSQDAGQANEKDNDSLENFLSQEFNSKFDISPINPEKRLGLESHFYTNDEPYFKSLKDKLEEVSRFLKKYFAEYAKKTNLNSITYRFHHKTDKTKFAEITIDYDTNNSIQTDVFALFQNEHMTVHKVYPIPAREFLKIDYDLKKNNHSMKVKWQIHNILGNLVAEKELLPFETTRTISLEDVSPGLYFYTIVLDTKPLLTKKIRIY